jgi:pyruvate/2-oxoglutarate dehydrogenase complex dihydrolipoamide dehydrogenase (E3) component
MSQPERFDALILGSGQGGRLLAWHLARSGKRTAMVERRWIGGSCPNIACLPSKNEIWSAKVAHQVRHAARYGTKVDSVSIDMATVRQRKRDMVDGEVAAHLKNDKATGVVLIMGSGRFVAPKTLEVQLTDGGTRLISADQVFLNVGTHAAMPGIPGLETSNPLTHIEALDLDYAPAHLIVLGSGYVGLELAQTYRRFGSRVTVIERGSQIMVREDADVVDEMQRILSDEGVRFMLSAEVLEVRGRSGKEVSLTVSAGGGEQIIEGSDILVAIGRVPNSAGIGLDAAGVALNDRGYIRVNERLETSAQGVWAIGECAGSPQFTHASIDDFRIIRDNLAGANRTTRDRLVPYCLFTDPALAHVGLNEAEARRQGIPVRVARLPMSAVPRTVTTGENRGFMKVLIGQDDGILGFTMIGAEADGVMTVVQTVMLANLPYSSLRDAVLAHPTMMEALGLLLSGVPPRTEQSAQPKKIKAARWAL